MTTAGTTPAPTPGHPDGCSCGECGCRQMHAEGAHKRDICEPHGRCIVCDGCPECEERQREEGHARYIAQLVQALDGDISSALQFTAGAGKSLAELTGPAYDVELAETAAGIDAAAELEAAARHLRNVQRIARERQRLLREG